MLKEALNNKREKNQLRAKHHEKIKNIEAIERLQNIYIDGDIYKTEFQIAKTIYESIHIELKDKEVAVSKTKEK